jgi:hypothetical protein
VSTIYRRMLSLVLVAIVMGAPCLAQQRNLRPSEHYVDYGFGPPRLHVARLSRNRKLASIGDMLYLLDRRNQIVWKWSSDGQEFNDLPVIDSAETIYVVGQDLLWAAIDSASGREKWVGTANGRASYSQIRLYRGNMYLVVTDMSGYRESLRDRKIKDELSLCQRNAVLWETHIPANARIAVSGAKVLITYKHQRHFIRRLIIIPRHFGKPIARISVFADYDGQRIKDAK